MAWTRATLPQIAARVKTDLATALDSSAAFFRRSFERGVQGALAGVSHHLHGHLAWIAKQIDPATADEDIVRSVHAASVGITPRAAVAAQFTISTTGTNGTNVAGGTVWQRGDGARYTVNTLQTVSGGTVTLTITAEEAGDAGNMADGEVLTILSPIAGLSTEATVTATTVEGEDDEDIDDLVARVQQRRATPPRGGAEGDYVAWLLEVAGVEAAWEYPRREGAGTVTCYGVAYDDDETSATYNDPVALSGATITAAETHLDQPGKQPTTVDVYIYTPTLTALDLSIAISPNTTEVQNAVKASLRSLIRREGSPGGMTLEISQITEAISTSSGEIAHDLLSPVDDVVYAFGTMPILGAITWSTKS